MYVCARPRTLGNSFEVNRSSFGPRAANPFLTGLELYRARPDKGYSLTDCISMATMRREHLADVLTNDRHFEKEGFRVLVRL